MPSAVCSHVVGALAPIAGTALRPDSSRPLRAASLHRSGAVQKHGLDAPFFGPNALRRLKRVSSARPSGCTVVSAAQEQERQHMRAPPVGPSEDASGASNTSPVAPLWRSMQKRVVVPMLAAGVAVTLLGGAVPAASAADALKTCQCLLQNCAAQLAECLENPGCAANIACLNTCNGRPDETECQIKCGDLFQNSVVDKFNKCAVSDKGCVPQKQDEGKFPEPKPEALVPAFDTSKFTGDWYISAGLNPIFDTFDCQLHTFQSPGPQQVSGNLTWRINTPDGGFFTRSAVQNFKQDEQRPGILYNHGNEFLHYEDDWYIVSDKLEGGPDDYVFVYYRGRNDAWTGYGGAVVYTRAKTIPESVLPEIKEAAKRVGLDYSQFKETDNSCGPQQPLVYRLATQVKMGLANLWESLQYEEQELEKLFEEEEALLLRTLNQDEKELLRRLDMSAREVEELFKGGLPSRSKQ